MNISLEVTRILLRYVAGALIAKGIIAPEIGAAMTSDPEFVQVVAGVAVALITEAGFVIAKLRSK